MGSPPARNFFLFFSLLLPQKTFCASSLLLQARPTKQEDVTRTSVVYSITIQLIMQMEFLEKTVAVKVDDALSAPLSEFDSFVPTAAATVSTTAGISFRVNDVIPTSTALLPRNPDGRLKGKLISREHEEQGATVLDPERSRPKFAGLKRRLGTERTQLTLICPDAFSKHPNLVEEQKHSHGFISAILLGTYYHSHIFTIYNLLSHLFILTLSITHFHHPLAFDKHLPLSLRPEHFWLLILQQVAFHVCKHPGNQPLLAAYVPLSPSLRL